MKASLPIIKPRQHPNEDCGWQHDKQGRIISNGCECTWGTDEHWNKHKMSLVTSGGWDARHCPLHGKENKR